MLYTTLKEDRKAKVPDDWISVYGNLRAGQYHDDVLKAVRNFVAISGTDLERIITGIGGQSIPNSTPDREQMVNAFVVRAMTTNPRLNEKEMWAVIEFFAAYVMGELDINEINCSYGGLALHLNKEDTIRLTRN